MARWFPSSTSSQLLFLECRRQRVALANTSIQPSVRQSSKKRISSRQIDPSIYLRYWDTVAPNETQLKAATRFFTAQEPLKLWTASEWRQQQGHQQRASQEQRQGLVPEVAFLGRSNVGKSSLINGLLRVPGLNHVSSTRGRTKVMHAWGIRCNRSSKAMGRVSETGTKKARLSQKDVNLAVLDMPGYGHGSRSEWGEDIVAYLKHRKQMRRVFVLIDAMHGVKSSDIEMIRLLRMHGTSYQVVFTKCERQLRQNSLSSEQPLGELFDHCRDTLLQPGRGAERGPGLGGLGEIIGVGNMDDPRLLHNRGKHKAPEVSMMEREMLGIEHLRWAVLVAVGLENPAMTKTGKSHSSPEEIIASALTAQKREVENIL